MIGIILVDVSDGVSMFITAVLWEIFARFHRDFPYFLISHNVNMSR